jgi:hypothetical protein
MHNAVAMTCVADSATVAVSSLCAANAIDPLPFGPTNFDKSHLRATIRHCRGSWESSAQVHLQADAELHDKNRRHLAADEAAAR